MKNKKFVILATLLAILALARLVMFLCEDPKPQFPVPAPGVSRPEQEPAEKVEDGILHGTFPFKDGLFGHKTVVGYLVPVDDGNKPRPGSEQMIFYAPFTGEEGRVPGSQVWLRELAKETGCTVFTMKIPARAADAEDRKSYFIYPESGWHDMVFKTQRAVAEKLGFRPGKLLVAGESSGGSMAQQFCAANPEKIMAAAWTGGSRYHEEIAPGDQVPRLILNVWGCPGEAASIRYAEKARRQGIAAFDLRIPPDFKLNKSDHHAPNEVAYRLIGTFLGGIARGGEFSSPEFIALRGENLEIDPAEPKFLAVLFAEQGSPLTRDISFLLRQEGGAVVSAMKPEAYRQLPVYLIGVGADAQSGIINALKLDPSRVKRIILFDTPPESLFEEFSIATHRKGNSPPILYYGDTTMDVKAENVTLRPLTERGNREYAEKVREALQP